MQIEATSKTTCLSKVVDGRSFADVGGLWGTKGEMVSHAIRYGATKGTMIDAMPESSEWWTKFQEHCLALGLNEVRSISADIMSPTLQKEVGIHDVVHCSGVMYHLPDCWGFLRNLLSITNEYLLVTSEVVPSVIRNSFGTIEVGDSGALCTPCLGARERAILDEHYRSAGRNIASFNSDTKFVNNLRPTYGPWWWLFTSGFMDRMFGTYGVTILWRRMSASGMVYQILIKK